MATLPKILKTYRVDKILRYRQLPPNREKQIIFGWEERNDLPSGQDLILCRPASEGNGESSLSTKEDYGSYFRAIVGADPTEFLSDTSLPRYSDLRIAKDFAIDMAKLLTSGEPFVWMDSLEFSILPERVS